MSSQNFQKPSLNNQQHIELLKNRGLMVESPDQANHYLDYVGYYRLSGFFRPFYVSSNNSDHFFEPGTQFAQIVDLYEFDTALRSVLLSGIERIEVAVRAVINNIMSARYGAHWYLDQRLFINEYNHSGLIKLIKSETDINRRGGKNPIFQSYYEKYSTPELPACWMLGEILSFGVWSKIYQNLINGADKKRIARKFNIPHYHVLASWLHAVCFTRNLCAHHAMISFKNFHITPIRPMNWQDSEREIFNKQHTVFLQASIVQFLLKSVSPNTRLGAEITSLFNKYSGMPIAEMGFEPGWENYEVWK